MSGLLLPAQNISTGPYVNGMVTSSDTTLPSGTPFNDPRRPPVWNIEKHDIHMSDIDSGKPFWIYFTATLLALLSRVRQSMIDCETLKPMTIVDMCVPQKQMEGFCIVCEIVKPLMTKHCRLCEECFTEMDHHCQFLLKCIEKYNHVMFVWFLIAFVFSMLLCTIIYAVTVGLGIMETVTFIFFYDAWLFSLAFVNIVSIIWGVNLINFQLQMVARGQLTAIQKYTKIQSGLITNEKFWNVINFLMSKSPYAKDPVLVAQNLV